MDQVKIGKLIAKLRKEKGLTQSQLGEMVGVGDRAVSKWERGVHCPNLAILNLVSEILGITTEELLNGELKQTETTDTPSIDNQTPDNEDTPSSKQPKFNKKLLLIPLALIIIIISFILFYNRSKVYTIKADSNEYQIFGKVVFTGNKMYVSIDRISFNDKKLNMMTISNYEYDIVSGNNFIFKNGYLSDIDMLDSNISLAKMLNGLKITFTKKININTKYKIINNGLIIKFNFCDESGNIVTKDVEIILKWLSFF